MQIIDYVVGGVFLACMLGSLYSLNSMRASRRTFGDRISLLDFLARRGTLLRWQDALDDVTFDMFWDEVVWFRNPWRLYPVAFLHYIGREGFISPELYNDAVQYAHAREAETLDRITRARKQVEDMMQSSSSGRGSDLPPTAFRNE